MKRLITFTIILALLISGCDLFNTDSTPQSTPTATASPAPEPTPSTSGTNPSPNNANLFVSLAGKTQTQVDGKLNTVINNFFAIGTGETSTPAASSGYRCYYELPQDGSMAFIWAADSNDIRSEGMSYGMMIAVQMNLQTQFDKLWKFAKTYMQYPGDSSGSLSAWRYYFRWQLTDINVSNPSEWTWTRGSDTTPAPDGDEYFAMALYLADRRWGSAGTYDYKTEADNITDAMLNNTASGSYKTIIDPSEKQVNFCPIGSAATFTDPSYHLPAFYECFASWGPSANAAAWANVAQTSRNYLVNAANATTGLHPDYAGFDGTPVKDTAGTTGTGLTGTAHDTFRYDAWRLPMNIAMDADWIGSDARMTSLAEKYHSFFSSYKGSNNVSSSLFALDGSGASGGGSTALTATLASAAMVSSHADAAFWVNALWNVSQQSGTYRYYQECVYILGMLNVAGVYKTEW